MFSIPDEKGRMSQPNNGDSQGNIHMSYGLDFETNKGRVEVSSQMKKLITDADNADFDGYAAAILADTSNLFAVSDFVFTANDSTPLGTWTKSTTGDNPDSGNTIMDGVYFNGLILVSEATDIKAWNGSTWSSWWVTTMGQSALQSGERQLMKVASDGNLYIVDNGNLLYKVTPTGTVTKTGAGTLDFSATKYEFTCIGITSNRLFIGTESLIGESAVIIEWDLSASSNTANKLHKVSTSKVMCIAVDSGDVAIAVLDDGTVKYFNNVSFVDFDNSVRFPVKDNTKMSANSLHPNGWSIIDDMVHFLVSGRVELDGGTLTEEIGSAPYQFPAGAWCLDPAIGLYNRFPIGSGEATQADYGQMGIVAVGALYALKNESTKFLASYEYLMSDFVTTRSVLAYYDFTNTKPSRGFLMTPFAFGLRKMWKNVELWHKNLVTGEKIRVFYRSSKQEALSQAGAWASTTQFNIVGTSLGIVKGDIAFIKTGSGAGQLMRVDSVSESSSVTSVVFTEPNTFVTATDQGIVDFLNFKFMGEITDTTQDFHSFVIPTTEKRRKLQFLYEFQQAAGNKMELDYTIINPE